MYHSLCQKCLMGCPITLLRGDSMIMSYTNIRTLSLYKLSCLVRAAELGRGRAWVFNCKLSDLRDYRLHLYGSSIAIDCQ